MDDSERKRKGGRTKGMDSRFDQVATDPKFRTMPRKERKVTIDDRFAGMFNKPEFRLKYSVDMRGRPLRKTTDDHLKRLYDLPSSHSEDDKSESEEEADVSGKTRKKKLLKRKSKSTGQSEGEHDSNVANSDSDEDESPSSSSSDDEDRPLRLDLARGDGNLSSSSGDSSSEWELEDVDRVYDWAELDKDAKRVDETTHRLAVCNMDWDRVKADDLLVLLNSFAKHQGAVKQVTIYPSEFGRQRMTLEDAQGPTIVAGSTTAPATDGNVDVEAEGLEEEDGKLNREQMELRRQYQLERLRYYYAVIECDSVQTAESIYNQCDGVEYETSAVRLDMRFIPNDMTFDGESVHDEAKFDSLCLDKYRPRVWENDALQKCNVSKITWDETDPDRLKHTRLAFNDQHGDLDQYNHLLAPDSPGDDQGDSDPDSEPQEESRSEKRNKCKALLAAAGFGDSGKSMFGQKSFSTGVWKACDKAGGQEMEISWDSHFFGSQDGSVDVDQGKQPIEDGKCMTGTDDKRSRNAPKPANGRATPWEDYLEKRKEKKRQRKAEVQEKRAKLKRTRHGEESDSGTEQANNGGRNKKKMVVTQEDEDAAAELDLLVADDNIAELGADRHFNLKQLLDDKKQLGSRRKKKNARPLDSCAPEADFRLNVTDDRFCAIFKRGAYAIDRSDPNFKETAAMDEILAAKGTLVGKSAVAPNHKTKSHSSEDTVCVNFDVGKRTVD